MRCPNAKIVEDYSNFKLGKKDSDAHVVIEFWNSSMGAKADQLQQAWFKVSEYMLTREAFELLLKLVV